MWLQLKPAKSPRPFSCILLVCVYYPHSQTVEAEKEMLRYVSHRLDIFQRDHSFADLLIVGDFNRLYLSSLYSISANQSKLQREERTYWIRS